MRAIKDLPLNRRSILRGGVTLSAVALAPNAATAITFAQPTIVERARQALESHRMSVIHADVVGVADFSRHCSEPRFFLVDIESGNTESFLVTHGVGSDPKGTGWLERFSNERGSRATSEGSYITSEPYEGQYGASQRLVGLDLQNFNALDRAIVIHPADYVSAELAAREGMIGLSWGCFAFSHDDIGTILTRLGPGRLLHAFA